MLDTPEKNMEFSRMTIGDVEALVGKKASKVEMLNRWIGLTFSHPVPSADIRVMIRKW